MSRIGTALCFFYACLSLLCLSLAMATDDAKSRFVFMQLPIALQAALVGAAGGSDLLKGLSWTQAYAALALPTLAFLYGLGFLYGRAIRKAMAAWRRAHPHPSQVLR